MRAARHFSQHIRGEIMKGFKAATVVLMLAAPAQAGTYTEYASPAFDYCSTWTEMHSGAMYSGKTESAVQQDYWLYGYVTGAADLLSGATGRDTGMTQNRLDAVHYVHSYCKSNPSHTLQDAAGSFVVNVMENMVRR
jgi:hypothetical protein